MPARISVLGSGSTRISSPSRQARTMAPGRTPRRGVTAVGLRRSRWRFVSSVGIGHDRTGPVELGARATDLGLCSQGRPARRFANVDVIAGPVLTVTVNPALDVAVTVAALVPDHKMHALDSRRDPGGGGVNVSRALRRLGVDSEAFVVAGGPIGDELVSLIEAEGVTVHRHDNPAITRESIAVRDMARNVQYRVVVDGPAIADTETLHRAVTAASAAASVVVISGNIGPGTDPGLYRGLVDEIAQSSPSTTTVVDCAGPALAEVVRSAATIVKPSRRELASLVEWTPATTGELEVAAREVLGRGRVQALAVSLGALGAMLVERDGPITWYRPPEVDVVSTVGSGDTMVAALVAGLLRDQDLVEATRLGVAAGTATCLTDGTELCRPGDVDRILPLVRVGDDPGGP